MLRTRRRQNQRREIAIEQRQIFHRFVIEDRRHVGAVGLQLGSFGGHFDGFGRSADLELSVDASGGVGRDNDVLGFERLEAGAFGPDVVNVGDKVGHAVVAVGVGGGFLRRALGRRRDHYLHARNRGARRIGDGAENAAENRLCGRLRRAQRAAERQQRQCAQNNTKNFFIAASPPSSLFLANGIAREKQTRAPEDRADDRTCSEDLTCRFLPLFRLR